MKKEEIDNDKIKVALENKESELKVVKKDLKNETVENQNLMIFLTSKTKSFYKGVENNVA